MPVGNVFANLSELVNAVQAIKDPDRRQKLIEQTVGEHLWKMITNAKSDLSCYGKILSLLSVEDQLKSLAEGLNACPSLSSVQAFFTLFGFLDPTAQHFLLHRQSQHPTNILHKELALYLLSKTDKTQLINLALIEIANTLPEVKTTQELIDNLSYFKITNYGGDPRYEFLQNFITHPRLGEILKDTADFLRLNNTGMNVFHGIKSSVCNKIANINELMQVIDALGSRMGLDNLDARLCAMITTYDEFKTILKNVHSSALSKHDTVALDILSNVVKTPTELCEACNLVTPDTIPDLVTRIFANKKIIIHHFEELKNYLTCFAGFQFNQGSNFTVRIPKEYSGRTALLKAISSQLPQLITTESELDVTIFLMEKYLEGQKVVFQALGAEKLQQLVKDPQDYQQILHYAGLKQTPVKENKRAWGWGKFWDQQPSVKAEPAPRCSAP